MAPAYYSVWCRDHVPACRSGAHFDGNCRCIGADGLAKKAADEKRGVHKPWEHYEAISNVQCYVKGIDAAIARVRAREAHYRLYEQGKSAFMTTQPAVFAIFSEMLTLLEAMKERVVEGGKPEPLSVLMDGTIDNEPSKS